MPVALPLILVGVGALAIFGLGYVAVESFKWYLSTPQGAATWDKIVKWVDAFIRAPIDWAFGGVKDGITAIADTLGLTYDGISALVDFVKSLPKNMQAAAATLITAAIFGRVTPLQAKLEKLVKLVTGTITARISTLESWRQSASNWLHKVIEVKIAAVALSVTALEKSLLTEITKVSGALTSAINTIKATVSAAIRRIETLEKLAESIYKTVTIEIPAQIVKIIARVSSLETLISTTLTPMFNQFNQWKEWLKKLVDEIKGLTEGTADSDLLDDASLMIASTGWLATEIAKAAIEVTPEMLKTLKEGFDYGG